MRDVTKTKASHHKPATASGKPEKQTWPVTYEGVKLAEEVKACPSLSNDTKTKLTREIMDHEGTHGKCTETFGKKIRRQLRAPA